MKKVLAILALVVVVPFVAKGRQAAGVNSSGQPAYLDPSAIARRTSGRPDLAFDSPGKGLVARNDGSGHRTPESARDERLESEPARHRVDPANHHVPGSDWDGVHVGYGARARCRGGHRRRGKGRGQLLAHARRYHGAQWRPREPGDSDCRLARRPARRDPTPASFDTTGWSIARRSSTSAASRSGAGLTRRSAKTRFSPRA